MEFLSRLFDTSGFPPRWQCGKWSEGLGWLHIVSDLAIWGAYVAIPCVLGFFLVRKRNLPFRKILALFVAFILACGTTHLVEAVIFWHPVYRFAGALKCFTAIISWATVLALVPVTPRLLAMRSPEELEREIAARELAEAALQKANLELEGRVQRRTAQLAEANTALRDEREWFRTTLASIGDAVVATDVNGLIRFMNPVAEHLAGWPQGEAAGSPVNAVLRMVNETTRAGVENPVDQVMRERRIVGLANHTILVARGGRETPIEDSAAPIWDQDGRLSGVVLVFRDVTEARTARTLLAESEERLRMAIESADMGTWDYNPITGDLNWDARCKAMFGLPPDTPVDYENTFLLGLHPEDREPTHAAVRKALEPGLGGEYDVEFRTVGATEGRGRWVASRGRTYFDGAKRAVRFIGIVRDVTLEKRAAEDLRAAKEAAEEASEAKSRFLAILSHELRTPLNPVLLAVTAMLEHAMSADEIRTNLAMIRQNVNIQARLIDDLLDVMKIVRGKMPMSWEVGDTHALIERAIQVCLGEIGGKQLALELDLAAPRRWVNTDPTKLQQVFWNLIKNAVKFTPRGGKIAIRTRNQASPLDPANDRLVIEVADNGMGIEPDDLPRIFDPFHQGGATATRLFGGLGLGLTICKGAVEGHGGTLQAESPGKGGGSTFRISLPTVPEPTPAEAAATPAGDAGPTPPDRLKILLVEDDRTTRELLARLLGRLGYQVATADSLASALETFSRDEPDLIVSDIGLPDGTGLDFMREVVATHGVVPAIALTGFGMEEDIHNCRTAGFLSHMTKPIDFAKLESRIRQVAASPLRPRTPDRV